MNRPRIFVYPTRRHPWGAAGALALAALALLGPTACRSTVVEPLREAPAPVSVATAVVESQAMPRYLALTGTLQARQRSDVAANVAGRVVRTFVERGGSVAAGAPLVQLDLQGARLSELEAQANLEAAHVQQQTTRLQCDRHAELLRQGAISRDEWERIDSECRTSQNRAKAAAARAGVAAKLLQDSTVRAPFAARVDERYVQVGEYVAAGGKIATLVAMTPLLLQLSAPQEAVARIKPHGRITFQVAAYGQETFTAEITYIAPALRTATRDLIFEALVHNRDERLRPGMFATAQLALGDDLVAAVPRSAITTRGSTNRLLVVVDGHLEERIVQLGPERGALVAALEGVQAGDTIVVEPDAQLSDGMAVQ